MNVTVQPNGSGTGTFNNPQISYYLAATGQTWDFRNATVYLPTSFSSGVTQIIAGTNVTISPSGGTGAVTINATGGGGTGTVTNFTSGNLSPLFTTAVATSNSTPALSFSLSNAAGYSLLGNNSGSTGAPAYNTLTSYLDTIGNAQGTLLYRGPTQWVPLAPGTSGYVLQTNGSGANPTWVAQSGGGGGVSSITGTASQILANGTTGTAQSGAVTLTLPQNISATSSPQFTSLGIGTTAGPGSSGIAVFPSINSGGSGFGYGIYNRPNFTVSVNNEYLEGSYIYPTITNSTYTNISYYGAWFDTPSQSGSLATAAQIYISQAATATDAYGIYQVGTDKNVFGGSVSTPTLKIGTLSGLLKATSGTVSVATSSTDYAPATTGNSAQLLANNGTGGFSNVNVGAGLSLSAGTLSASGSSGVTSITGSANILANGTTSGAQTGAVTLTAVQGITTTSSPQFSTMGLGSAAQTGVGLTVASSLTSSTSSAILFGTEIVPTYTAGASSQSYSNLYSVPLITTTGFTGTKFYNLNVQTGTLAGTLSESYQLYIAAAPTAPTHYGIFQAGTDANVLSGSLQVPAFTATGTTTLATSLTGYLYGTSGVVSAVTTIPTSALSGTISLTTQVSGTLPVANGGTGVTTSTGTGSTVLSASPTFTGTLTAANLTATGTTTLATSLTGYLSASSGVVSASSTIPTTALSGTITNAQLANSSITFGSTAQALGSTVSAINGVTIGASSATTGTFTTLTATGTTTLATSLTGALSASSGVVSAGTLSIANGGTSQTTAAAAQRALTPATSTVTTGASPSVNWSLSNSFDLTLTSATAASMAFTNAQDGQVITIAIHQPASGTPTTVSWSGITTILWAGGTAPTQTATLSKTDVYTFYYNATAAKYYGSYVQNF